MEEGTITTIPFPEPASRISLFVVDCSASSSGGGIEDDDGDFDARVGDIGLFFPSPIRWPWRMADATPNPELALEAIEAGTIPGTGVSMLEGEGRGSDDAEQVADLGGQ